MPQADRQQRAGIALIIAAAIAWSTAPFFVRSLHFDSWTILFWRGLFGGTFIALFLVLTQGRSGVRGLFAMKGNGWLVACLSTIGMVTFIPALQLTSVANAAIIVATQPFVAAAIAWIWLRETVWLRTMWPVWWRWRALRSSSAAPAAPATVAASRWPASWLLPSRS